MAGVVAETLPSVRLERRRGSGVRSPPAAGVALLRHPSAARGSLSRALELARAGSCAGPAAAAVLALRTDRGGRAELGAIPARSSLPPRPARMVGLAAAARCRKAPTAARATHSPG